MSPSMDQLWTVVAESECKPVDDVIGTRPMSHDSELKKTVMVLKSMQCPPREERAVCDKPK